MPEIEAKGEADQVKLRIKSLLTSSGLQVFGETSRSLKFRKAKLSPSGNFPLSIYGSGEMRLESSERGSTLVSYNLNISPVTVFSFAVTGLSILIFAFFTDYYLITLAESPTTAILVGVLPLNIAYFLVLIALVLSFAGTRKRAERFLRMSLE